MNGKIRQLLIQKEAEGNSMKQSLARNELVAKLRSFKSAPVIKLYRLPYEGKSPREILARTMGNNICRAFPHETPSLRYKRWRWYSDGELLRKELDAIKDQETFDCFAIKLGESLVTDWGTTNELGGASKMNIGVAMKIANLALKHLSFYDISRNPGLIEWLHVPWDSNTLRPLRKIWRGPPVITNSSSQGFVKNLAMYQQLHSLISGIAQEAGVSRIIYEFWAWDDEH
jgi:hypothetical protein